MIFGNPQSMAERLVLDCGKPDAERLASLQAFGHRRGSRGLAYWARVAEAVESIDPAALKRPPATQFRKDRLADQEAA